MGGSSGMRSTQPTPYGGSGIGTQRPMYPFVNQIGMGGIGTQPGMPGGFGTQPTPSGMNPIGAQPVGPSPIDQPSPAIGTQPAPYQGGQMVPTTGPDIGVQPGVSYSGANQGMGAPIGTQPAFSGFPGMSTQPTPSGINPIGTQPANPMTIQPGQMPWWMNRGGF